MTQPPSQPTPEASRIRSPLFDQVLHWKTGHRQAFMGLYRRMAHARVTLEYVGKHQASGDGAWDDVEPRSDTCNRQLQLQMVECLVNGSEAARCLRSRWPGPQTFSTGIELHSLRAGALHARFFH